MLLLSIISFNLTHQCSKIKRMLHCVNSVLNNVSLIVISMDKSAHCDLKNVIYTNTTGFHPKQRFWYELVRPVAPTHASDAIWLLDEDMYMNKNNISKLWSFWNETKPLLSQPLIEPSTQFMRFLNYNQWSSFRPLPKYIPTTYVEIQTPIFRADFFAWFTSCVIANHGSIKTQFMQIGGRISLVCCSNFVRNTYTERKYPMRL